MNTNWKIKTHGDPLGTLQNFVRSIWEQTDLDVFIVAPNGNGFLLESPEAIEHLNPFRPMMKLNTARLVVETAKKRPGQKIGVILRPCEMRALNEIIARGVLRRDELLAVCVDCLGTFPIEEVEWRAKRSKKGLTKDALQFAPQGGISAYRYRPACQMCTDPGATGGDVNIGVLGLPVRQSMLIGSRNGNLELSSITDGIADEKLVSKHEQMLAKITEKHGNTRERVVSGIKDELPKDLNALLELLESCGSCEACMDACPICSVDPPRRSKDGKLIREDVANWLLSCAGCGMCEQSCPQHQPLSTFFDHVRNQVDLALAL